MTGVQTCALPIYEGQWVQRRTRWHGLGMGCPIPYQRGTIYYFYTNEQRQEVRHGEFRDLHGNGVLSSRSNYRHGKSHGTLIRWNSKGEKTNEEMYENGKQIGWSIYTAGKVHYHNEQIFDNGTLIAWRRFENGGWFLQFPVGQQRQLQIDPRTGVLSGLK